MHLEPEHVLRKRQADQPLRIKIHYDDSVQDLPSEKFEIINVSLYNRTVHHRTVGHRTLFSTKQYLVNTSHVKML